MKVSSTAKSLYFSTFSVSLVVTLQSAGTEISIISQSCYSCIQPQYQVIELIIQNQCRCLSPTTAWLENYYVNSPVPNFKVVLFQYQLVLTVLVPVLEP